MPGFWDDYKYDEPQQLQKYCTRCLIAPIPKNEHYCYTCYWARESERNVKCVACGKYSCCCPW